MIRRADRKSMPKQANEESEINVITDMVCTVNKGMARDKAHDLVLHYYKNGIRDISQIGFMILMSPERVLKLPNI